MQYPELMQYDVNALMLLAERTTDELTRNEIKAILINKISSINYPTFVLVNKFICSSGVKREIYAEIITIRLKDERYLLSSEQMDEIIECLSLDTLGRIGARAQDDNFRLKCINMFWQRGKEIEDKVELERKRKGK